MTIYIVVRVNVDNGAEICVWTKNKFRAMSRMKYLSRNGPGDVVKMTDTEVHCKIQLPEYKILPGYIINRRTRRYGYIKYFCHALDDCANTITENTPLIVEVDMNQKLTILLNDTLDNRISLWKIGRGPFTECKTSSSCVFTFENMDDVVCDPGYFYNNYYNRKVHEAIYEVRLKDVECIDVKNVKNEEEDTPSVNLRRAWSDIVKDIQSHVRVRADNGGDYVRYF